MWASHSVLGAALIVVSVLCAWSNSLSGPFLLDDHGSILGNASIQHLWPPDWLKPPATTGETVSGRPVLNFSFALNYALGGWNVHGYHVGNLLIHAAAALALWGILRRTPATGGAGVALAATLLWAVHPLHTAAITYVVQRAEALAALFGLLTLYAFLRGAADNGRRWFVFSVVFALLGVGTKETVAVIPLLVLLYDRAFLTGGFLAAWRAHGRVHAALFATWLPLAGLVLSNHGRGGSVGTGVIGAWSYLLTQGDAIMGYLRLVFWPAGQVFDHGTPVVGGVGTVALPFLLLGALAAGTVWQLARNRSAGFAGAAFFLLLAPSSSIVPVATQTIAEHRMYLPLAAVVVLTCAVVASTGGRGRRLGGMMAAAAILALGLATFARNQVYRSELTLWQDTVVKRPDNPRARHNLGMALAKDGRTDEAIAEFRQAIALRPNHAFAHFQLGTIHLTRRQWAEAAGELQLAVAADPHYTAARINLGQALAQLGRAEEAIAQYRAALAGEPAAQDARINLAALLVVQSQTAEAEALLREAIAAAPELAEAHYHLGLALEKSAGAAAAEAELQEAVRLKPELAAAHLALGNILAARGDLRGAEASCREAMRQDPASAEAHYAWGNLLAKQQHFDDALAAYHEALRLDPSHVPARNNLANCQFVTGRLKEAITNYEAVLRVRPGDAAVKRNLKLAREALSGR